MGSKGNSTRVSSDIDQERNVIMICSNKLVRSTLHKLVLTIYLYIYETTTIGLRNKIGEIKENRCMNEL